MKLWQQNKKKNYTYIVIKNIWKILNIKYIIYNWNIHNSLKYVTFY